MWIAVVFSHMFFESDSAELVICFLNQGEDFVCNISNDGLCVLAFSTGGWAVLGDIRIFQCMVEELFHVQYLFHRR